MAKGTAEQAMKDGSHMKGIIPPTSEQGNFFPCFGARSSPIAK
ncbi:hypothetical protein B8V81_1589 [Paenibacillus pasadenensis]|uniref:Uncharacterized protein n=1 Tax=Paenibacillus pasadenensis TaxID=217090 RepID=A0A2N5NAL6_9BACL|nr:hypothetical protein B8V81_1589 [Paenibacillus pasadenensis]